MRTLLQAGTSRAPSGAKALRTPRNARPQRVRHGDSKDGALFIVLTILLGTLPLSATPATAAASRLQSTLLPEVSVQSHAGVLTPTLTGSTLAPRAHANASGAQASNWAGYEFSNSPGTVTASVVVPQVSCPADSPPVAELLTAEVQGPSTDNGAGVAETYLQMTCSNQVVTYSGTNVAFNLSTGTLIADQGWAFTPTAGDTLNLRVKAKSSGAFTIIASDTTQSHSSAVTGTCGVCHGGEGLVGINQSIGPIPSFGKLKWSGVTVNGAALQSAAPTEFYDASCGTNVSISTSAIGNSGESFSNKWVSQGGSVCVPASGQGGVDSGLALTSGEGFAVVAGGTASYGLDYPCETSGGSTESSMPMSDPDGFRNDKGNPCGAEFSASATMPTAPVGELIARIGTGPWFAVGSSYASSASASGELNLAYNDSAYSDNSGSYFATAFATTAGTSSQEHWFLDLQQNSQMQPCTSKKVPTSCDVATIDASLVDANGNPIAGQQVELSKVARAAGGTVPSPTTVTATTNSTGSAVLSVSSTAPQYIAYNATVVDPPSGVSVVSNDAVVFFTPPATSLSAIGVLNYVGSAGDGECSGSLVASPSGLVVVTAGHCVTDNTGNGQGFWEFFPGFDFSTGWAPYGAWKVTQTFIDNTNYPSNGEAYDYAFFSLAPDSNGVTTFEIAGSLPIQFGNAPTSSCCTQYSYPTVTGLLHSTPPSGSTNYESGPDSNGAAQYNLSATNWQSFVGTSSGGPLLGPGNVVEGVLQGSESNVFFSGVVGAYLEPIAESIYEEADTAAGG
jgi:hypothetical protein